MRRLWSVLLPLTLALAACGERVNGGAPFDSVRIENNGRTTIVTAGVTIEVDGTVPFQSRSITSNGGLPEATATLWGHGFGVVDGTLRIGSMNYGAVAAGDRVRINHDGVFVNDTRRGDAR